MTADTRLVVGPNASLSERGAWVVIGMVGAAMFAIAGIWTWLGFWPVLPFAGLELIAVVAALSTCMRRNRYREVIEFRGENLVVEVGMAGRGVQSTVQMPRYWTKVDLVPGAHPHHPSRLMFRCSGQSVEIGRCVTDEERVALAARIRQLLHRPAPEGSTAAAAQSEHYSFGDR
jgi:uncharacterized membrane protein